MEISTDRANAEGARPLPAAPQGKNDLEPFYCFTTFADCFLPEGCMTAT